MKKRDLEKEQTDIEEQIKVARTALIDAEADWAIEQKRLRQVWLDLMDKRTELVKEKTAIVKEQSNEKRKL